MFLILLPLPFTGIIPAHAGLTSAAAAHGLRVEDHPRGCGAHAYTADIRPTGTGSSPRMRGSLTQIRQNGPLIGIIPADAGLTPSARDSLRSRWNHPRGCGAHVASVYDVARPTGSSPRMRGSPLLAEERASSAGGIPADAGLTRQKGQRAAQNWGHPRGCGAH